MASFEEEALRRAQQMHSRPPHQTEREKSLNRLKKARRYSAKTDNKQENKAQGQQKSLVDFLLADKEQSLILLLLLLLSGEKADPSLLLALMYLLM